MIVVLDACVLYPPSLRDLLLTLAALDAFEIRWSEEILDEVTRNVVVDNPDIDPARFVGHTIARMRAAFPEAMTAIDAATVEQADNNAKDRHVAALAVTAVVADPGVPWALPPRQATAEVRPARHRSRIRPPVVARS